MGIIQKKYLIALTLLVGACSINDEHPEFDFQISDRAQTAAWPRLVPLNQTFPNRGQGPDKTMANTVNAGLNADRQQLQNNSDVLMGTTFDGVSYDRVARLQDKIRKLQRPVLTHAERTRLLAATKKRL